MLKDNRIIGVIMGGGRGTRLYPLTKERCKPAVPLCGKYRLVDIPISNCLHSGINRIYLLTQFNTASLHRHIQNSYRFDTFSGGFVDILSAEQTMTGDDWYQGTADAVRRNLAHLADHPHDLVLILSGDQLYRMDFREIIRQHLETKSDVTIASLPVPVSKVEGLGVMRVNEDLSIAQFVEKPRDPAVINSLALSPNIEKKLKTPCSEKRCLASMGIYVFSRASLRDALENNMTDFGKEVIPSMLGKSKLSSYIFEGYWEDIGTVRSFFEANLAITDTVPPFDFFTPGLPIYSHARYLPPSKINACKVDRAIIADGCILGRTEIIHSTIGLRSIVRDGTRLENVVMMGADYMERHNAEQVGDIPGLGIGRNCIIKNAIIDKNARIGDNCVLTPEGKPDMFESMGMMVRDGVLCVFKNAVIPAGTVI
jgi:glucose-1-phosphate adenylyltransferase